jgi:hypothetical protein
MGKHLNEIGTDVYGVNLPAANVALKEWGTDETVANDTDAVMTSTAGKTSSQDITEDLVNPPCPRSLTVTAGGTAGDIKAGSVRVYGTNYADEEIYEDFTFTADTAATKSGVKAFKTVTKVSIPAQDGTGCTFTVGTGSALGLPLKLASKPLFLASLNGSADAGTLAVDDDELEKNTYTPNASLAGTAVKLALVL